MTFFTHLVRVMLLCVIPHTAQATLNIYTEEWAPISFSVDGQPDGLAVQVVQEIQKRIDNQDPIKIVPWARGWKIMTEQPNTVLFAMTRTPAREQLFSMIGPIATGTINFYALKDSQLKISSIDDAKQAQAVGVYRSSVEDQLLMEHQFTNIAPATTPLLSAKQLMKKRIDLWCNTNLTAPSILAEAGASIDEVKSLYTISENHLYISFSKGTPNKEIEQWKEALIDIKADGTFAQIYHRWLPNDAPPMETERVGQ
ncbi:substrate-binding periplasmic protein [Shewanella xiamenensis]|uniref:substrate-binding periplasmic protein n=1 Tax=Shewanella xiamenensis TaxID=332186 RepID=UPI0024A7943C|nr:ABC transporter substrate-binding protein [Shewanella xiamenensis]MDI5839678.1 ABC transporter substrate-binding protein [Shewanella xiamenensis]MDI5843445.1 ABC transporter substrate-binding protein [Shewanella xiamenensis]MDI5848208.1 ABC transporter substrate-binding protein [Shewanella xiamenensis]MDI5851527.1 ABC transporter substrate-binding protein [Shewanella xiamenensis]MDI5855339.1 ABC transporter substrate-binding protein [Shewanella xiamenensis]